jgi:hypothetical protein
MQGPSAWLARPWLWIAFALLALVAVAALLLSSDGSDEVPATPEEGVSGAGAASPAVAPATGATGANGGGATGEPAAVPPELLGQFSFIGDGVIEFAIEGDRIIGRTVRPPLSTGIELVGGAVPCLEFSGDVVFSLDLTGRGEWFWYDAPPCVRFDTGGPVTVDFSQGGATATGFRPPGHPDADGIPVVHAMQRVAGVEPFTPAPRRAEDSPGDVRNGFGQFECVDRSGGSSVDHAGSIDIVAASVTPAEGGRYTVTVQLVSSPTGDPRAQVSYVLLVGALFQRDAPEDPPGSGAILGAIVWQQLFAFGQPPAALGRGIADPADAWAELTGTGQTVTFEVSRLPDDVAATDLAVEIVGAFEGANPNTALTCSDNVLLAGFR